MILGVTLVKHQLLALVKASSFWVKIKEWVYFLSCLSFFVFYDLFERGGILLMAYVTIRSSIFGSFLI